MTNPAQPQAPRLDDAQVGGNHYSAMNVTPWQFLESCLTPEEFRGYLKGEAIVYLARELQKGGRQDVAKAAHVLQKLLEAYPQSPSAPPGGPVAGLAPASRG